MAEKPTEAEKKAAAAVAAQAASAPAAADPKPEKPAKAPKAEVEEAPRRVVPLAVTRWQLGEFLNNRHSVSPAAGTPFEDLLRPEFWANIVRMAPGDIIEVRPEDQSYFAELYVLKRERNSATEAVIREPVKLVSAYKPQIAYFAALSAEDQLLQTIDYIKSTYPDIPVILDAKRGDIGSTAEQYAKEAFERYGADAVSNGLEAIAAIEARNYDVVFMDLQMLEMDGLEASRQIRQRLPAGRQPKIVALTANAMQGDRQLCLAAGMDDYISKPVKMHEIEAVIRRLFSPPVTPPPGERLIG